MSGDVRDNCKPVIAGNDGVRWLRGTWVDAQKLISSEERFGITAVRRLESGHGEVLARLLGKPWDLELFLRVEPRFTVPLNW